MKYYQSHLLVGLLAIVLSVTSVYGRGRARPKPTPPPRHTVIASITSDSITIDTGLNIKSYKLDQKTQFTYLGRRVALNDLKPGMRVSVIPGFDAGTAVSISAGDAPKIPPANKNK